MSVVGGGDGRAEREATVLLLSPLPLLLMACRCRLATEVRTSMVGNQRVRTSMLAMRQEGAFPIENPSNLSRGNGRRSLLSSLLLLPWLREVNIGSQERRETASSLVMRTFTAVLSRRKI